MNASKGDGNAMYEIGLNYYNGTDFTQDKDISSKWLRHAANTCHKEAQFKLAEMYKESDVVEQDYHKRSIWIKTLAKKKDDVARYNLGILYREVLVYVKMISKLANGLYFLPIKEISMHFMN
jgi:TPR repeat protein